MVVYTTLAALVETIAESRPLARHGFGLKSPIRNNMLRRAEMAAMAGKLGKAGVK
jgi:hypothetical protein